MDEQINIEAEWTPPFKPDETHRERQDKHAKHQRMLQDHRDAKALRRERHRAGWHKFKMPTNTLA